MPRRLSVIQDDLMFAQRALFAARRLGVSAETMSLDKAETYPWSANDVVVIQATLRSERQLTLIDRILQGSPQTIIVAVAGHLETDLRRQLKKRGVRLAAHSAMDRVLARALGLSGDDADADADRATPHPSP